MDGLKGLSSKTRKALETPPAAWDAFGGLDQKTLIALETELSALAQRAVMLSRYLFHRWAGRGHGAAVKECNKALTQVRKTLGYAYPKAGEIHF